MQLLAAAAAVRMTAVAKKPAAAVKLAARVAVVTTEG
jgi:hypothetical protein